MILECFKCTVKMEPIALGDGVYVCAACGEPMYETDLVMWAQREETRIASEPVPPKAGPKSAVQLQLFPRGVVHAHISREIGEPYNPQQPVHEWARREKAYKSRTARKAPILPVTPTDLPMQSEDEKKHS